MKKIVLIVGISVAYSWAAQAQLDPSVTKVDSARIWFDRGVQSLFNHEKVEYQIDCYTKALQLDPKMLDAYRYRAADYFKINQFEACIQDCNSYFNLAKKEAKTSKYVLAAVHFRRAEALAMLGKYKEAKADYQVAVEYMPTISKYVEGQQRNQRLLEGKH